MLASALAVFSCESSAARPVDEIRVAAPERSQDMQFAQSSYRDRDLRGRQRHIDQYRNTPPRRDNDRFLRERREETADEIPELRREQRDYEPDRSRTAVPRLDVLPLSRIRESVEQFCPGTFVDATLNDAGVGLTYDVTIERPNGRRVDLQVDAGSGAVLSGRCN